MTELVKPPPKLKKKLPTFPNKRKVGSWAENKAALYLDNLGLVCIDKNVQLGHQELDLICWDTNKHELVFVEVKYRKNYNHGGASLAISNKKLKYLQLAIKKFIHKYKIKSLYRLDFVSITGHKIAYYQNISW